MAKVGKLQEFDERKETFANYVERTEQYFSANEVANDKKVAVFLSVIGPTAYGTLKNLVQPELPKDKTYDELVATLKAHYMPKPLVISERFKFNRRQQKEGECINAYVVELKKLATHCEFGNFLKEALRDRLVCGLRSEAIQKELLSKDDLDFDMAVKIATGMETAAKDTQSFGGNDVHYTRKTRGVSSRSDRATVSVPGGQAKEKLGSTGCFRCGMRHNSDSCQFKDTKCFNCSKIGHLARKCPKKKEKKRKSKYKLQKYVDQSESDSDDDSLCLHTVYAVNSNRKGFEVDVDINDNQVTFQLDTGSACTIVNEETYNRFLSNFELENTNVRLKSYTGEVINLKGECVVPVKYDDQLVQSLTLVVAEGSRPNLLGRDWLNKIKLNWQKIFSVEMSQSLKDLKIEYKHLFEKKAKDQPIKGFKATIRVKENAQPIFCKARPVPYALKDAVEKELKSLQEDGIIYQVRTSDWAAPLVCVPKPDNTLRLCGDFKVTVNRCISDEEYPIPSTQDMFATLAGGDKFTKLDLSKAYSQLELEPGSEQYLTINSHLGLFRYRRLAYGISSAPAIFQSVMDQVLAGLPNVICRIDDILVTAPDDETHLKTLREVFKRLGEHNIRLREDKCSFMKDQVVYMGHLIDRDGLHTTDEKVEAVLKAPSPTNVSELKSYLGLINYYGPFLEDLSTVLHPLHELLKKGTKWIWTQECEDAFNESKSMVANSGLLVHCDLKKPVRLACDASSYGCGAVISHIMEDGSERPIAFASRTFNSAEKNYSQLEREALSMIFGVKKFHKYLYGRKFTLITDHKPLTTIFGSKKGIPTLAAARLQRWAIILSAYNYDIVYRKSQDHGNCDCLSRLPVVGDTTGSEVQDVIVSYLDEIPVNNRDIAEATRRDPVLSKVYEYTLNGWPNHVDDAKMTPYFNRRNELSVDQGVVLWGLRVIIPGKYRARLLDELHDEHIGMSRMKNLARSYIWYPKLDSDIEEKVRSCSTCQLLRKSPPVAALHPWKWATRPWQRIHVDYADFKNQSFFIIVDSYSKWIEVFPMKSTTSSSTIDKLRMLFASTGLPEILVSDNGSNFTSEEFKTFLTKNGIKHILTPPYHPASNGLAERSVQELKKALKSHVLDSDKLTLRHRLANFLLKYRTTPHSVTSESPAELFLRRQLRNKLTLVRPDREKLVESRQDGMKKSHDRRKNRQKQFCVNDSVLVKTTLKGGKKWKWISGIIHKVKGPLTYLVKIGNKIRYCHLDHLVQSYSEIPNSDSENGLSTQPKSPNFDAKLPEKTSVNPSENIQCSSDGSNSDSPREDVSNSKQGTDEQSSTPSSLVQTPSLTERRYPMRERKPPDRLQYS